MLDATRSIDVGWRLDQLGDGLAPEEREKVETALAERVRRVTDTERAELDKFLVSLWPTKCG